MSKQLVKPSLGPLCVEVLEAKPNKMFTAEQTAWIRFLRYNRSVACAECGKKKKTLWTMLCEFRSPSLGPGIFALPTDTKIHPPLAGVCGDHPLAVAFPKE